MTETVSCSYRSLSSPPSQYFDDRSPPSPSSQIFNDELPLLHDFNDSEGVNSHFDEVINIEDDDKV